MSNDFLFESTHNALRFAFTYSLHEKIGSPIGNLLPSAGAGNGLCGVDGAAQAGMIRVELSRLTGCGELVLIARVAPMSIPCDCGVACCSKRKPNEEWRQAVDALSVQMIRVLSGNVTNYRLRRGCVEKFFGRSVKLVQLADHCGVHRDTASAHNAKIAAALKKDESRAWAEIYQRLKAAGLIGVGNVCVC